MWPGFIHGRHHAVVAKAFEEIASGKIKTFIECATDALISMRIDFHRDWAL
jgi:hypothetical protein